jgi:septal ring factor EnvC (AmiA/AmiB activator)
MNENQLGVLLENILDRVNVIAEGQKNMEARFETRFTTIEKQLATLNTEVKDLKDDMKKVKSDVKIIKSFVVAIDEGINDHERRISFLEKQAAK